MTEKEAIDRIKIHMTIHRMAEDRAIYITEALNMAIEALEAQRWIPISEGLPEEGQDILAYRVFGEDERIIPANYSQGCWFDCHMNCSEEHVVAWMPLPKPYLNN